MDKRRVNFTPYEKEHLLRVIGKFKHIIDDKSTKSVIVNRKRNAWMRITNEFNYVSESGPRTVKQLMALYHNLKRGTSSISQPECDIKKEASLIDPATHHTSPTKSLQRNNNFPSPSDHRKPDKVVDNAPVSPVQSVPSVSRRKPGIYSLGELRRQYLLKKIELANFELRSKRVLFNLEAKKLKMQISKLETSRNRE